MRWNYCDTCTHTNRKKKKKKKKKRRGGGGGRREEIYIETRIRRER